jgi:hypothetical protein
MSGRERCSVYLINTMAVHSRIKTSQSGGQPTYTDLSPTRTHPDPRIEDLYLPFQASLADNTVQPPAITLPDPPAQPAQAAQAAQLLQTASPAVGIPKSAKPLYKLLPTPMHSYTVEAWGEKVGQHSGNMMVVRGSHGSSQFMFSILV